MVFININKEKTKKLLAGPWFFLGPIILWFLIMCYSPQGFIDLFSGSSNSAGFIEGLAAGLATKAGITATWAHMVIGDIFVTRWIWKKCLETNSNLWTTRLSIFFGVMLMPVGLGIFAISNFLRK